MASPVKKGFDSKTATGLVLVVALGATVGTVAAGILSTDNSATSQQIQTTDEFAYDSQTTQPSRDSWFSQQPQSRSFGFSRGS